MKIAVIGNLGHLNYLFDDLPKLPECQVVAACSAGGMTPDWTLAAMQKLDRPAPQLFEDYKTMLDAVKVDIAVIGGPFEERAAMCKYCIERNIAVFTEKPCAITLEELAELESAVKQYNGVLYGMMGIRFEAPFYTAFKLINAGVLGAIKLIYTRKSYKIGKRPEYFFTRSTYGGTIPWVGSHAIDLIQHCNVGDFKSVNAWHRHKDNDPELPEITAHCVFTMENGAIASADIDYLRPATAGSHGDDRLRAVGASGIIEVAKGKVEIIDADGTREITPQMPPFGVFGDFVRAKHNVADKLTAENLKLTRACILARDAADSNKEMFFNQ